MNKLFALLSVIAASVFLYGCGIKGPLYIEDNQGNQIYQTDEQQPGTQDSQTENAND